MVFRSLSVDRTPSGPSVAKFGSPARRACVGDRAGTSAPASAQSGRAGAQGRAGCHHVVDQRPRGPAASPPATEPNPGGRADRAAARGRARPGCAARPAALQAVGERQSGPARQRRGDPFGLVVAAAAPARRVQRAPGRAQTPSRRPGRRIRRDLRRHHVGHPLRPAVLERRHERARRTLVGDRRPDGQPVELERARPEPAQRAPAVAAQRRRASAQARRRPSTAAGRAATSARAERSSPPIARHCVAATAHTATATIPHTMTHPDAALELRPARAERDRGLRGHLHLALLQRRARRPAGAAPGRSSCSLSAERCSR